MRVIRTRSATAALLACLLVSVQPAQGADTLYARLGGYDAIAGFVDTAFPRVAMHSQLSHLFRGHSIESQRRQRQLIVDALCQAAGGPCFYTGRDMKSVHVGLGVTEAQWSAFMTIISGTAAERGFGKAETQEFLALFVQQFRPLVVEGP